jgi:DNA-binding transcriptional LysR family regulator
VWKGTSPAGAGFGAGTGESATEVADIFQLLHLVAAGQLVEMLPRSLVPALPPGVVVVPIADAPPSHLVLAWNEQDRRPLVTAFVRAVTAMVEEVPGLKK